MDATSARLEEDRKGELKTALAGLCATLVGIGLARFAYAPLLPALIEAGWFTPAQAAYLGAANLMGYLAGAASAGAVLTRVRPAPLLRWTMLLAAATFIACSLRLGFPWFLFWRFLSGLAGGLLMVAAAPTVLAKVAAARRGRAGGIMFMGVGLGIAASGTLIPLLLEGGLVLTWLGLGAVSLLLTGLAWRAWPDELPTRPRATASERKAWPAVAVLLVTVIYGLDAVGLVPHMVFFIDYVARGLGYGVAQGSLFWVVYGVGAIGGPLFAGWLGDRVGFGPALAVGLLLQLLGVAAALLAGQTLALGFSALVMGAFTPGMPALVLGRLQELTGLNGAHAAWGTATTVFAVAQAAGAYGYSALYARGAGYGDLFLTALAALGLALLTSLLTLRRPRPA